MKQLTCAKMGGPATCQVMLSGNTAEEAMTNGWKHIQEAIQTWLQRLRAIQKRWEALPEV